MPYKDPAEKKRAAHNHYIVNRDAIRKQQNEHNNTPERRKAAVLRAQKYHERVKGTAAHRYVQLKSQAKQRGLQLDLDSTDYALLVAGNRCKYCGNQLPINGHGLDRVDNRLGYAHNNVVPCCTFCNTQKGLLEKLGFVYPRAEELLMELVRNRNVV